MPLRVIEVKSRDEARRRHEADPTIDFAILRMAPKITYIYFLIRLARVTDVPDAVKSLVGYRFKGNEDSYESGMVTAVVEVSANEVLQALAKSTATA